MATKTTAPATAPTWRNRITGSGEEAPDQLVANPANWRIHTKAQQDALAGALDVVGWVQQVLVNRRTGHVTAAASLAVGLLLVAPPFLRVPIATPSSMPVGLVGVATLTLGWHRVADAVGGTLVATAWAACVGAVLGTLPVASSRAVTGPALTSVKPALSTGLVNRQNWLVQRRHTGHGPSTLVGRGRACCQTRPKRHHSARLSVSDPGCARPNGHVANPSPRRATSEPLASRI